MKLTALADLKTFMQKDNSTDDNFLNLIIEMVSPQIENYLNRDLEETARTVKFNGGTNVFFLKAYPVNTSPAPVVKIDGQIMTENSDYFIDYDKGTIEFFYRVTNFEPLVVEVTYTGGYTVTNKIVQVPADIKMAVILQCSHVFMRRDTLGVSAMTMPDGTVTNSGSLKLLPGVLEIIDSRRNHIGV